MAIEVVEGWTGPIDILLSNDGVPEDLTGKTIAGVFKDRDGVAVDMAGDVTILGAPTAGTVRYLPDSADLVAAKSPYTVRIKVTAAGADVFFPNGEPEILKVYAA